MTNSELQLGSIVRIVTMARTDAIGVVTRFAPNARIVVRLPSWQADGYGLDVAVERHELEPRTAREMLRAAEKRTGYERAE